MERKNQMKQPKFKFGDKVIHVAGRSPDFIINKIEFCETLNCYIYKGFGVASDYSEHYLNLYKEKKKITLYCPVLQNSGEVYYLGEWTSRKLEEGSSIVGWLEKEVEVSE